MRTIARAVPPRPVLITAVALTTAAGSTLLRPRPADATPRPVPRRGSAPDPVPREGSGPGPAPADGSGGPAEAAGRPSVISGRHAVPFGTEPLFRDHPKGELPQVGRALFTMAHTSDGTRTAARASSGSVEESG